MDNATYDELTLTPINTDETYSRLRITQTKTEPSYELQQRDDINQSAIEGAKQNSSKDSPNNMKYNVVLIIMIVVLTLFTSASIALSIITYSQLTSEQSEVLSQQNKTNNAMMSVLTQLATIQSNVSQMLTEHDAKLNSFISVQTQYSLQQSKVLSQLNKTNNAMMSVFTQLATIQSNVSQMLAEHDAKLNSFISVQTQYSLQQSKVLSQLNKTNNAMMSVFTQLATIQSNVSQMLAEHDAKLNSFISVQIQYSLQAQTHCGPGLWHRLAFLNMSDPAHQCPFAWREYNTDGVRACGRPVTSEGSCPAIFYFTGRQYSRVCGRVIGYQFATPDAFERRSDREIDLDAININYGAQRNHIWSYVAGWTQSNSSSTESQCPCSTDNGQGSEPPSSIGDNYYCESGNPHENFMFNHLYTNDPLWDGQQCEGTCCNGTNSPPWFSVPLPAPTTDIIQVSICCDQGTNDEDTPVELIEIYVQ